MKESNPKAKPVAPYVGGKRNLAGIIVERIQAIPHRTYAEPFVGMGGVFLRRPERAPAEYINDLSRDVSTFFRVLQRHYVPFIDMLRYQITTRTEFDRLVATDPATLTDLERSARFLYLQRTAFGGKVSGRTFGITVERSGAFDVSKLVPALEDLHTRLTGVTIECLPYADFIARLDRPATLFYLDPPYWGTEDYYGKAMFYPADFKALAEQLGQIRGKFLMSINDVPEIRGIFAGFAMEQVTTTYTVRDTGPGKKVAELIISNS